MSALSQTLAVLTGCLFCYIMYLETFATASPATCRVFNLSREQLAEPKFNLLMRNQGVYNGCLGVSLLYAALFAAPHKELAAVLLFNCAAVAVYGAATGSKSILFKQGGLPILALISLLF